MGVGEQRPIHSEYQTLIAQACVKCNNSILHSHWWLPLLENKPKKLAISQWRVQAGHEPNVTRPSLWSLMSYCASLHVCSAHSALYMYHAHTTYPAVPHPPSYPTVPCPLSLGLLNGGEGVWEYHWEGSLTGGWALLRYWKTILTGNVQLCSYVASFPGSPRFLFSGLRSVYNTEVGIFILNTCLS